MERRRATKLNASGSTYECTETSKSNLADIQCHRLDEAAAATQLGCIARCVSCWGSITITGSGNTNSGATCRPATGCAAIHVVPTDRSNTQHAGCTLKPATGQVQPAKVTPPTLPWGAQSLHQLMRVRLNRLSHTAAEARPTAPCDNQLAAQTHSPSQCRHIKASSAGGRTAVLRS